MVAQKSLLPNLQDPLCRKRPRMQICTTSDHGCPRLLLPCNYTYINLLQKSPRFRPLHHEIFAKLWSMTLEYLGEQKPQKTLTDVSMTLRHVSRAVQEEIEKIFMEEHMGQTWPHTDCSASGTLMKTTMGEPSARTFKNRSFLTIRMQHPFGCYTKG